MDGKSVVYKAREWVGTPWHHQGRVKGVGSDCVGLIVGIAKEFGLDVRDEFSYPREPNGLLSRKLEEHLVKVPLEERREGDVVLFRILDRWEHVGIVGIGAKTLIHVHQTHGKCLEHRFDERWVKRLVGVYRWPN